MPDSELVIGIDTGGTHTDAVLLHYRTRAVVASGKTLTTRDDLARGVVSVIEQLPIDRPERVKLVGISSTLATNSIAESKTRRVALLLIGYDAELVETCGLRDKLWTKDFEYFRGGHTASGEEQAPLDLDALRAWAQAHANEFDALAISSYFSPLDPSHEVRARDAVREIFKLPIVMGHELSTVLDSVRRAATASLNASLVAVMSEFIEAVRRALAAREITAPLMVVKGDGSLLPYQEVLLRPVETVLSGPAASAVGGQFFADRGDALIVDMGGTTTDIALLQNGTVTVSDQGARVGNVHTSVPAARVTTVCVGCDSRIAPEGNDGTSIGPDRVMPLCRLAVSSTVLQEDLKRLERLPISALKPFDFEYWVLAKPVDLDDPRLTTHRHKRLVRLLQSGPQNLTTIFRELDVYHGVQMQVAHLFSQGVLEVATLTPTDLLHSCGLMKLWDAASSSRAVQLFCAMQNQDPDTWTQDTLNEIVRRIAEQVVVFLARYQSGDELPEQIDDTWARWMLEGALTQRKSLLDVSIRFPLPLVGIGAPAGVFLRRVAELLDAPFVLPPHHHVANAAGAVAGLVMVSKEAIVYEQGEVSKHGYRVQLGGRVQHFKEADDARRFAEHAVRAAAVSAARDAGAIEPLVHTSTRIDGSLHRFLAKAIGAPGVKRISQSTRLLHKSPSSVPARERSN